MNQNINKWQGVAGIYMSRPIANAINCLCWQDIAIVTGAEYIASDLGMKFEETVLEQLGQARKITVAPTSTTIIAEAGSQEEIAMRVAQIKKELERSDSVYDIEKLSERIAKLTGGIAVIKVGTSSGSLYPLLRTPHLSAKAMCLASPCQPARSLESKCFLCHSSPVLCHVSLQVGAATEAELEDRKLRIEDAKNATFAAVEEGIVPGGGAALFHLSQMVRIRDFHPGYKRSIYTE